jgi:hypothetical protein
MDRQACGMICESGTALFREDLAKGVKEHFADVIEALETAQEEEQEPRIGKF